MSVNAEQLRTAHTEAVIKTLQKQNIDLSTQLAARTGDIAVLQLVRRDLTARAETAEANAVELKKLLDVATARLEALEKFANEPAPGYGAVE